MYLYMDNLVLTQNNLVHMYRTKINNHKAKYFPDTSVMEAKIPANSSYA